MLVTNDFTVIWEYKDLHSSHFWSLMFVSGLCGFAIGYVTSLQIKVTSPLTHNVSGTAKACAQTVIATYWYSEVKGWLWWLSNLIVLIGSAAYTNVKQQEMRDNYLKSRVLPMKHNY
jgi:GDP-fucose transporter C1